jgi:AraC-like DNA-binding protein
MRFNEYVGFKLNTGVRVSLEAIKTYPFHLHAEVLELVGLLYGHVTISDCATDHVLSPGDVYIFNPNDPHRIVSNEESGLLTVQISREGFSSRFPALKEMYYVCQPYEGAGGASDSDLRGLRFLMARLWLEYNKQTAGEHHITRITEQLLQMLLEEFTFYTYRKNSVGGIEIVRQPMSARNISAMKRYYLVADQIYKRFDTNLTLTELAAEIFVSPEHLSRSLKSTVGLTFSELLSLARSEEAERLLFTTQKNVDEIANQVGFANRKHLAMNFKRWYKKTPTDFRQAVRKDQFGTQGPVFGEIDEKRAKIALEGWLDGK